MVAMLLLLNAPLACQKGASFGQASGSLRVFGRAFSQGPAGGRPWRLQVSAAKGFDAKAASAPKKVAKKAGKLERYLDIEGMKEEKAAGWARVASLADFVSKPVKPVILETGQAIVLYKVGDKFYCSAANSTAFQFPLHDGKLIQAKTGPAVEVPLDGTTYDLATGKVLAWCPKNNPIRSVLGSLKDKTEPVDLQVYPAEVRGEEVFVRFT